MVQVRTSAVRFARVSALALVAALAGAISQAHAEFTLIDNFQGYVAGTPINGQGAWKAEAKTNPVAAGVTTDPLNPSNRVLNIGDGGYPGGRLGHRETINTNPALLIGQTTTATVFFRLAWNVADVDLSIGMSDVANPITDTIFNSFEQFQSQLQLAFSPGFDKIAVNDGGSFRTLTTDVGPLEWYNFWLVIDNYVDVTQIYLQGGAFASPTLLTFAGDSTFGFRNGPRNTDLITFFIATGRNTDNSPPNPKENIGPVYLDDLYVDTSGVNLVNPVPEPASWATGLVAAVAFCGIAICRRSRRFRTAGAAA